MQEDPTPKVHPQTHLVNLRNNKNYTAKNGKFVIHGKDYFNSVFYLFEIKK